MNNRKQISQADMQRILQEGGLSFPPLQIAFLRQEPLMSGGRRRLDALIEIRWGALRCRFAIEMKALSTPMALRSAINDAKGANLPSDTLPMIMLPYLSRLQLQELEQDGVSGIDLCGNGLVMVPEKLFIMRTGQLNRYTSSAPIKNIYRKNSSMVPRVFLAKSRFESVSEVLASIMDRNLLAKAIGRTPMAMSTVSKAIKAMEEDLIVNREQGLLKLIQPDKLLEKLLENYVPANPAEVIRRRVTTSVPDLPAKLAGLSKELNLPIVATGLSSATRYAVMQRGDLLSVYCSKPELLLSYLPSSESDRFPNLALVPCEDETVYFDSRLDEQTGFRWAAPLQAYLEMMRGDKRDQETAAQVRSELIRQTRSAQ